jgi:hypothetical protein
MPQVVIYHHLEFPGNACSDVPTITHSGDTAIIPFDESEFA